MGIGADEFLREFEAAAAFLSTDSGVAATILDDLYINRWRGIAFRKPSGWEFQSLPAARRAQSGISLHLGSFDPELFREYINTDETHAPFVIVADMKAACFVPEALSPDVDHLATMLTVSFEGTWQDGPDPSGPFSLSAYVGRDLGMFAASLLGYTVVQEPRPLMLSCCDSIEYVAKYHYEHADLPRPVSVRERVIYVSQAPAIYSIRMLDYPDIEPPLTYDFDSVVSTFRFL